jgi:hypothetical protein
MARHYLKHNLCLMVCTDYCLAGSQRELSQLKPQVISSVIENERQINLRTPTHAVPYTVTRSSIRFSRGKNLDGFARCVTCEDDCSDSPARAPEQDYSLHVPYGQATDTSMVRFDIRKLRWPRRYCRCSSSVNHTHPGRAQVGDPQRMSMLPERAKV